MFWFQKKSYQDFHAALLAEISSLPASKMAGINWENSSYSNDACGSIMYAHDNDHETYVQLFAFETKEDAILELGEEHGTQYAITVSVNGDTNYACWDGDDREEAMVQAIIEAEKMMSMDAEDEDEPDFYDALANELNQRTNQIKAEWETVRFRDIAQGVIYVWGMDSDFQPMFPSILTTLQPSMFLPCVRASTVSVKLFMKAQTATPPSPLLSPRPSKLRMSGFPTMLNMALSMRACGSLTAPSPRVVGSTSPQSNPVKSMETSDG